MAGGAGGGGEEDLLAFSLIPMLFWMGKQ